VNDVNGVRVAEESNEYVFVYDISESMPTKKQVIQVPNTFNGLAWNPDGRQFYVSGGVDDNVHIFSWDGVAWAEDGMPVPLGHSDGGEGLNVSALAAGLAVNASGNRLLVANYENDSISLIDLSRRGVVAELDLRPGKIDPSQSGTPGGTYPLAVIFKGDNKAYVASQRDREIIVISIDEDIMTLTKRIPTVGQPNKMTMNRAQSRLYIASDNQDAMLVVDTTMDEISETIPTVAPRLVFKNKDELKGANSNNVALSPDEGTLFVTNGGTNSVAVIQLAHAVMENEGEDEDDDDRYERKKKSKVIGLIPAGWYPNAVYATHDMLYVVNGKSNAGPNPNGCRDTVSINPDSLDECQGANQYVWQLHKAGFLAMPMPFPRQLAALTWQVAENNRNINVSYETLAERRQANPYTPDDPDILAGTEDVAAPDGPENEAGTGYLWDSALRGGLTVRNYGFYGDLSLYSVDSSDPNFIALSRYPFADGIIQFRTTKPSLRDITDSYFRGYDQNYPDYWRFKEWEREFDQYIAQGELPNLSLVRIPHDHFGNFSDAIDGVNTVETQMADNDYAIGLIAEKVANRVFKSNTLIFIIEDDAQNGADHVDAHRSIGYIIGPYVKQGGKVVSTHYTTVNMLRTIEDILGIEPMGINDGLAEPMADVFDWKQKKWDYQALVPEILYTTDLPLPDPKTVQVASGLGCLKMLFWRIIFCPIFGPGTIAQNILLWMLFVPLCLVQKLGKENLQI
jgi:DNA-binding beta-propeller fold protein YncE